MKKIILGGVIAACAAGLLSPGARAEADADIRSFWIPSSRSSPDNGRIGITRVNSSVDYTFNAGPLPVDAGVENNYMRLSGAGESGLPEELSLLAFPVGAAVPVFGVKNTYFRLDIAPTFSGTGFNAPRRRDFYWFAQPLLIYRANKSLDLGAGFSVDGFTHSLSPLAGFVARLGRVETSVSDRLEVTYALDNATYLFAESNVFFGSLEYRIRTASGANDILEYRDYYAGAGIRKKLFKDITASVSAGRVFYRRFRAQDSPLEVRMADAAYVSAAIGAGF